MGLAGYFVLPVGVFPRQMDVGGESRVVRRHFSPSNGCWRVISQHNIEELSQVQKILLCLSQLHTFFLSAGIDPKRNPPITGDAIQRPSRTPYDRDFDRIDEFQRFKLFMDPFQNMIRTGAAGPCEGYPDFANPSIIQIDAVNQSEIDDIQADFRIDDVHQFFFQLFLVLARLTSIFEALFQYPASSFIFPQMDCG